MKLSKRQEDQIKKLTGSRQQYISLYMAIGTPYKKEAVSDMLKVSDGLDKMAEVLKAHEQKIPEAVKDMVRVNDCSFKMSEIRKVYKNKQTHLIPKVLRLADQGWKAMRAVRLHSPLWKP